MVDKTKPENTPENAQDVFLPENLKAAAFCNSAFVQFSPEEFAVDFINMGMLSNSVVSRIVMTPSHTKRLSELLASKVKEYEDNFSEIRDIQPKK